MVRRADIDNRATNGNDTLRQFGRYDPGVQEGMSQVGCPSEASRLQSYASESAFQSAVNTATANVTGGTYHDVGMLWGTRFISRTGFFASDNPTEIDDVPVNQHIVFMTDGMLDTGDQLYSAHGVKRYQQCTQGSGSEDEKHLSRFASTCSLAKSMGITVNDVVFYTADISMPRLLPWHGFVEGMSPTIDMELETAVRSQPYGNQATPPVICAEPD